MHERASSMRVRDYINHVEYKIQREAWTVVTKTDTIMLKQWVRDASAFQAEMNKFPSTSRALAPEPIQL